MPRLVVVVGFLAAISICSSAGCSSGGCHSNLEPRALDAGAPASTRGPADAAVSSTDASVAATEPAFPAEVRSLRLKRSIVVRMEPSEHAERYGTVAAGTRVGWKRALENDDCSKRWIEIEPYGWVCEIYLEPSERRPRGVEVPRLEREEMVPGVYGKVIGEEPMTYRLDNDALLDGRELSGSVMVRRYGGLTIEEVDYWLIDKKKREYVSTTDIREYRPSSWSGVRLGDDTGLALPIGFPLSRKNVSHSVATYSAAQGGRFAGKIKGRKAIAVLEIAKNDNGRDIAYRVGPNQWVRAGEMRVAIKTALPAQAGPIERWIDVDLDSQVLVAYEGERPVYATLVATGSKKNPTPTGIHRIWIKFAETDMSDLAGESPYSVATVPWTQFYAKDLALHTAYWHDTFGTPRSHGCTNLAPADARFLYFWSDPELPPGWSMAKGTIDRPGSLVRIRNRDDPEPEIHGYAARILEARRARGAE